MHNKSNFRCLQYLCHKKVPIYVFRSFGFIPKLGKNSLACRHKPSIVCVWLPVIGSTKFSEWFTGKCNTSSKFKCSFNLLYAFHPSEQKIVPSKQCFSIIGRRDILDRFEGTCIIIPSNEPLSVIPKPHFSSSFQVFFGFSPRSLPLLNLGLPGK